MRTTPVVPPTHQLARGVLAGAGLLVLAFAATLFALSPLVGRLWSGCVSFVNIVRALW